MTLVASLQFCTLTETAAFRLDFPTKGQNLHPDFAYQPYNFHRLFEFIKILKVSIKITHSKNMASAVSLTLK